MTDKQGQLTNAIADAVAERLRGELSALSLLASKVLLSTNAALARMETIEACVNSGGVAAKRNIRAAPKKGGAAKADNSKKAAAEDDASKVTNALLFLRWALAQDFGGMRATYATEEVLAEAKNDPGVAKKDPTKDERSYYSVIGAYLWKHVFTDAQKEEVRTQFNAWKEQAAREAAEPQLEEDGDEDGDDDE